MEVLNSDLNTKENRWYELIKMEDREKEMKLEEKSFYF